MIELSKEQIIKYHEEIINSTGGSNGLRDDSMLESALASAFQTFGGEDLYPSVTAKIARVAYGIIRNHPFVDGNKRIGTTTMVALLKANNIDVSFTDRDIVKIGLELATGQMSDSRLDALIRERIKK
ncbi:MAG: type II toxin-antitoxin system death-on-curing family toxin [Chitinispirillales bacterium]|jgi:death-on-curing protein|nr:type II toxin-antitoxin system death-on-curing family toxin [Chitinispirillales bacterium]